MTGDTPLGEVFDRNTRIADYVLGQMDGAEAALFERDMARDSELAREVGSLRDRLLELDAAVEPLPATDDLWRRIADDASRVQPERAAAAHPQAGGRRATGLWRSLAFWRATGLAASAAVLLLAAGLASLIGRTGGEPVLVAVLVDENGRQPGAIVEIGRDGVARLITLQDIPVPADRALQIWTLQDRQIGPRSVGLLREAQSTVLDIGDLPPTRPDQLFEITLEPESGSPTGRPTGPILFKGTTTPAL